MSHINYVANGLGSQSMYLLYLATQQKIPATVSVTADTGWENDSDMMDGSKTTAEDFYHAHVEPFGRKWGIQTSFVRSRTRDGKPQLSIPDYILHKHAMGKPKAVPIPMFGSENGRLKQSCTDKWKISAMKQEVRRMGAKTARSAQGIHYGERARRVKGEYIGIQDNFSIYRTTNFDKKKNVSVPVKWLTHYYPLVDLKLVREDCRRELDRLGIAYLISSECVGCPHADPWRWLRRTDATIESVAQLEDLHGGKFFFTDQRRPLRDVIAEMRDAKDRQGDLFDIADFSCTQGVCGI